MTETNTQYREEISNPVRPSIGSYHVGPKSKEVLLQELVSLTNRNPNFLTPRERQQLISAERNLFLEICEHPDFKWIYARAQEWQKKLKQIREDINSNAAKNTIPELSEK